MNPQSRSPGDTPIAVITGGAGAVGSAIARRLAARGVGVVVVDRDAVRAGALAEALTRDHAVPAHALAVDLMAPDAAVTVVGEVEARYGRLDHLVNSAGNNVGRMLDKVQRAEWDAVLAVNLTVPMLLCQQALRLWRRQMSGRVVNIGSRTWLSGASLAYTSSKAGLVGLTRALAVQLGPYNVTVNTIAPSYLSTEFNVAILGAGREQYEANQKRLGVLSRLGTPEDVAGCAAFLLSDDAGFITGEVLHVAGGAQLAPRAEAFQLEPDLAAPGPPKA